MNYTKKELKSHIHLQCVTWINEMFTDIRKNVIARKIGVSDCSLSYRLKGRTPFSLSEYEKLKELYDGYEKFIKYK